jgi:ribosomal-protein-alanine N-acetyltransferase
MSQQNQTAFVEIEGLILPIRIRPARMIELDRLAAIGLAAWERGIAPLVPMQVWDRVRLINPFRAFLRERGSSIVVADLNGEPVGIAARDSGGDYISDLWVAPGREGRGVGSALLAALEARISQAGYPKARLEVLTANVRALALYRRRGYRPVWEAFKRDLTLGIELHKTGLAKSLSGT